MPRLFLWLLMAMFAFTVLRWQRFTRVLRESERAAPNPSFGTARRTLSTVAENRSNWTAWMGPLPAKCQNTVQGMRYIADSRGLVCSPFEVDHTSGCCITSAEDPFPCTTCQPANRCCLVYEYCVACCFKPAHRKAGAAALLDFHRRRVPLYADVVADDLFRFCRVRCRHSSTSTVYENRFRSDLHYCY
eukprot:GGOE01019448.1.p1 GENE.GGOE01019448.1~~GGOE01019448.1.p1  ORF type:complete len:189 (-),score=33.54 GGOE01019448.1:228-794(-)